MERSTLLQPRRGPRWAGAGLALLCVPGPRPIPLVEPGVSPPVAVVLAPPPGGPGCEGGYSYADLNRWLHDEPAGRADGGIVGADYARAQRLGDGRVLWTFQDVFVGPAGATLAESAFMHNAALVQTGSCLRLLTSGTAARPTSWIGGATEVPLHEWFWPLDAMTRADGMIAVFAARMENPLGTGAALGARPVGVWIATIEPIQLTVVSIEPAPDAGTDPLYGFSITSDETYAYLYGNCYRQFTEAGFQGIHHDSRCGPRVYVARIPAGEPEAVPEYWAGGFWTPERRLAAPISRRGVVANPMQIRRVGTQFVAVTKVDDWWGDRKVVDVAAHPTGPWTTVGTLEPAPVCDCSTYFAHLVPWTDRDGSLLVAISSNGWSAEHTADHPIEYRPRVLRVPFAGEVVRQ